MTIGPQEVCTPRMPTGKLGLVGVVAIGGGQGKADDARFAVFAVDGNADPGRRAFGRGAFTHQQRVAQSPFQLCELNTTRHYKRTVTRSTGDIVRIERSEDPQIICRGEPQQHDVRTLAQKGVRSDFLVKSEQRLLNVRGANRERDRNADGRDCWRRQSAARFG